MEVFIVLLATAVLGYFMFRILWKKLRDEIVMVRKLAAKNGWHFTEKPDVSLFVGIAKHIGFQPTAIRVQYLVGGTTRGKPFELFLIVGSMGNPAQVVSYNHVRLGYATVVRTHETLALPATPRKLTSTFSFEGWNYIVYGANAMTETEIQGLLDLLPA